LLALLVLTWLHGSVARAEFTIELKAQAGAESKTASAEVATLGVAPKQREVLRAKVGTRINVSWTLANADAAKTVKDVLVHFVAVKQEKLGQRNVPKLNKGVVAESALRMDFAPKDQTRGALSFTIEQPGAYLLRLETGGAGAEGEEYFAALDLLVE
jgi:hypothetical protein